jgi:hypothetical protein
MSAFSRATKKESRMASDEIEGLLNEIGQILAEDDDHPLEGTLLYAEVASAWVSASIYKDLGNQILFRWPRGRLTYALLDLWEEEVPEMRWASIEYIIRNGKFDVTFAYPEDIDPDEDPMDRRDRILKKYYGDKPVHYPPFPEDGETDSFEL